MPLASKMVDVPTIRAFEARESTVPEMVIAACSGLRVWPIIVSMVAPLSGISIVWPAATTLVGADVVEIDNDEMGVRAIDGFLAPEFEWSTVPDQAIVESPLSEVACPSSMLFGLDLGTVIVSPDATAEPGL